MDIFIYKSKLTKYIRTLDLYIEGDYYLYKKGSEIIIEHCISNHTIKIKNDKIFLPLLKEVGYDDTIFILNDILTELKISKKDIIKIKYIKI